MKEEFNIEIGQWVKLKTGKVIKVTSKNYPNDEDIERYATQQEIFENGGGKPDLELRMYFFVPYNISPRQQGIQAGRALGRYITKYGKNNPLHPIWEYLQKWERWVVLDGGTTNSRRDFKAVTTGTLNQIADALAVNEIEFAYFVDPELNDALSAVCFLCDEKVFNDNDYPEFWDYPEEEGELPLFDDYMSIKSTPVSEWEELYTDRFTKWRDEVIGGEKNLFLRELIRNKDRLW